MDLSRPAVITLLTSVLALGATATGCRRPTYSTLLRGTASPQTADLSPTALLGLPGIEGPLWERTFPGAGYLPEMLCRAYRKTLTSTRERLAVAECYLKRSEASWGYRVDLNLPLEEGKKPEVRAEVEGLAAQLQELLGKRPGFSGMSVRVRMF
jgi:hypothetical protein